MIGPHLGECRNFQINMETRPVLYFFLMGTPACDWACQAAVTGERGGKCLTRFRTVLLAGSGVGKRRQ